MGVPLGPVSPEGGYVWRVMRKEKKEPLTVMLPKQKETTGSQLQSLFEPLGWGAWETWFPAVRSLSEQSRGRLDKDL